ncbi:hypothetical protein [Aeromonas sobria]|uniref:hypothetical protein n=1 Tax=Aeromonas sobria TaxID=646 RepID=UPI00111B81AB|nr:hypothetical protein [Aeromonas sobria]
MTSAEQAAKTGKWLMAVTGIKESKARRGCYEAGSLVQVGMGNHPPCCVERDGNSSRFFVNGSHVIVLLSQALISQ